MNGQTGVPLSFIIEGQRPYPLSIASCPTQVFAVRWGKSGQRKSYLAFDAQLSRPFNHRQHGTRVGSPLMGKRAPSDALS